MCVCVCTEQKASVSKCAARVDSRTIVCVCACISCLLPALSSPWSQWVPGWHLLSLSVPGGILTYYSSTTDASGGILSSNTSKSMH